MIYDSISEASANSRRRAAISDEEFDVNTRACGKVKAMIVVESGVTPYFVYKTCQSIKVTEERPSSSDVDHVRKWRAY